MILRGATIFAISLWSLSGHAQVAKGDWLSESLLNESEIYAATREACKKTPVEDLYGGLRRENLGAGQSPSKRFNDLINNIFLEEFKKNSLYVFADPVNENETWLFHSNAFNTALAECYQDARDQAKFKWHVSRRKLAGKASGIAVALLVINRGTGLVAKFSASAVRWADRLSFGTLVSVASYTLVKEFSRRVKIRSQCGSSPSVECIAGALKTDPKREEIQSTIEKDIEQYQTAITSPII